MAVYVGHYEIGHVPPRELEIYKNIIVSDNYLNINVWIKCPTWVAFDQTTSDRIIAISLPITTKKMIVLKNCSLTKKEIFEVTAGAIITRYILSGENRPYLSDLDYTIELSSNDLNLDYITDKTTALNDYNNLIKQSPVYYRSRRINEADFSQDLDINMPFYIAQNNQYFNIINKLALLDAQYYSTLINTKFLPTAVGVYPYSIEYEIKYVFELQDTE